MSAATFVPAPILHPNHKSRTMRAVICPVCRRAFRPWGASPGYYCTTRCAGRARTLGIRMTHDRRVFVPPRAPVEVDHREIVAQCMAALDDMRALVAERGIGT